MVVVARVVETPVTTPVGDTVATAEDKLLHVPPVPVVDNVIDEPEQTLSRPEIVPGFGNAFTVTACVAETVPQLNVEAV